MTGNNASEGTYRERIDPPRGGESDAQRIIYQAAPGMKVTGLQNIKGGDSRFYKNLFIAPAGLDAYDKSASPNSMAGKVFIQRAQTSSHEKSPLLLPELNPAWRVRQENEKWFLDINLSGISKSTGPLVTSGLLGKAEVSALPFEAPPPGKQSFQVWPVDGNR